MIVRQSSLKIALDYFNLKGFPESNDNDLKVIANTAEYFTKYVMGTDYPTESTETVQRVAATEDRLESAPQDSAPMPTVPPEANNVLIEQDDDLPF
jgi:hypothetical protein